MQVPHSKQRRALFLFYLTLPFWDALPDKLVESSSNVQLEDSSKPVKVFFIQEVVSAYS